MEIKFPAFRITFPLGLEFALHYTLLKILCQVLFLKNGNAIPAGPLEKIKQVKAMNILLEISDKSEYNSL
jgi:hypothetical protein